MAKQIEIGLKLEGQDAVDFCKYMENPTFSQLAIDTMREAKAIKAGCKVE